MYSVFKVRSQPDLCFSYPVVLPGNPSCQAFLTLFFREDFSLRGDGEIRTHDPLLARQVLSQLSYTPICTESFFRTNLIWQPPALPHRLQCSTIGRVGLNHRVRDEYGCFPYAHRHQKSFVFNSSSDFLKNLTVYPTPTFSLERR